MGDTPPYIGVTGFMARDEIEAIQSLFDPEGRYKLMAGILASGKTIYGTPNRYPFKYPAVEDISSLLGAVDPDRAFGLIHYNTDHPEAMNAEVNKLFTSMTLAHFRHCRQLGGFQFNLHWPEPARLHEIEQTFQRWNPTPQRHVLQLGPSVLSDATHAVVARLEGYLSHLQADRYVEVPTFPFSYVLIDMSAGVGKELEWDRAYETLVALMPLTSYGLKIGVAGGLSAANVDRLRPMINLYPDLCIDAEGRLRDDQDQLDLVKTTDYVQAALAVLG